MDKSFEKFRLFFAPRKSCFRPTSLWIEAKIEVHCHATILALTQNRHQKYYCDCVWQNVTAKVKANHLRSLMLFSRLFNWVSLFWNALNATTLMLQRRVEFFFRIDFRVKATFFLFFSSLKYNHALLVRNSCIFQDGHIALVCFFALQVHTGLKSRMNGTFPYSVSEGPQNQRNISCFSTFFSTQIAKRWPNIFWYFLNLAWCSSTTLLLPK